jgi:hypothetical protein
MDYCFIASGLGTNAFINATLYASAGFTYQCGSISVTNNTTVRELLSPNTDYYLELDNWATAAQSFSLTVASYIPTFVSLTPGDAWTSGSIVSGDDLVWYKATVTPGTKYTINLDNAYEGSNEYTSYAEISAYEADRSTSYFTDVYQGYSLAHTQVLTVPSGETSLYILVSGNPGTYALKLSVAPASGGLAITVE